MPSAEESVLVRLIDPETGAAFGAVAGAAATRTVVDATHSTFALHADQVGELIGRVRAGKVIEIRDKDRVKWRCAAPVVAGESVTAACEKQGGEA